MALRTPLVCDQFCGKDHICRDGSNALVRPADAEGLAEAAASVLMNASLRHILVDGGLATLVRYRRARERLQLAQLLDDHLKHWRQAQACHHGMSETMPG
jgi:glycosyltransferase involved in cell wall biosynthesis